MKELGQTILFKRPKGGSGSTDMGNVSHHVPSFHGYFAIPTEKDVGAHNPKSVAAAGSDEAHSAAIESSKGMAMLALRVLTADTLAEAAKRDCETPNE
jgi:metal-dependent amidase/aminoacylase/carboxypeptidase family protein